MAHGLAEVNAVHGPVPFSEQFELFPRVSPRLVRLDNAPVLFPALTHAEYEPAGFLAPLLRMEGCK